MTLPSVTIVRRIKAPPARVWAAITQPDLMLQWWGPDTGPTLGAVADVRPGGRFRVVFRLLKPTNGGTELTLTHEHLPDECAGDSHEQGWNGLLNKLPMFLEIANERVDPHYL